jgi:hypothetical protein
VISSFNHFQATPATFLANFSALWIAAAKVADQNLLGSWVNMRHFSGAGINAFSAACALVNVNSDGAGVFVYAKRLKGAGSYAGIILALSTEMRELGAGNKHEHANPGGFGPNFVFFLKRAGDFAFSASAAF